MSGALSDATLGEIGRSRCRFGCVATDYCDDMIEEIRRLRGDLAEMTLCRDNAVRAAEREDVLVEFDLDGQLRDGLAGIAEWPDSAEPDHAPDWLIDAVARIVRPELARLTQENEQLSDLDDVAARRTELQAERDRAVQRWHDEHKRAEAAEAERDDRTEKLHAATKAVTRLADTRDYALTLLARFVDEESCRLDHEGLCQSHGLSGPPCRNAEARLLLGIDPQWTPGDAHSHAGAPASAVAGTSALGCPASVLRSSGDAEACAHCGKPRDGLGDIGGVKVCHTGKNPAQFDPIDCYRLVTVYGEPLGARIGGAS